MLSLVSFTIHVLCTMKVILAILVKLPILHYRHISKTVNV
ncbi:hypothetical protein B4109_0063 [Geobacillus stearothermophilus]|uniref:Uncharacterized protein n=1 Tax=Geobacillus stearothermophilus TaxID=1422 RepID=A0A150MA52_GEOSE|nr:hypothetical protein B4109_0063 [Geobacillus stearothermophilus]